MQLSDCLSQNQSLLGPNFEQLGNSRGGLSQRFLLSYTDKEGWQVLKLNIIQLIFRKIFGSYKSTHLNHIAKKINKLRLREDLKDCHARITALWTKKHAIGLGNSPFSEAQIICFAETHSDKCFRATITQVIDAHYQEGDVILVEGVEAGREGINPYLSKINLNPDFILHGWEPENFNNFEPFKRANLKSNELMACYANFKDNFKIKGPLTEEDIIPLEKKIEQFIKTITDLNDYYKLNPSVILSITERFLNILKQVKKGNFPGKDQGGIILCLVARALARFEENQEKAFHRDFTETDLVHLFNNVPPRNASLIAEINKCQKEGRRVFVIAGASHLLEYPKPWVSCKDVREHLNEHRFTIITRKRELKKTAGLNADLKHFPLFT